MDLAGRRTFRLRVLTSVCAALLVPALLAFLVNLELAIRVLAPGWRFFEAFFPAFLFETFTALSADLSTISTLVPVLLLIFPLIQGWRILKNQDRDPGFSGRLSCDPYPPFFSFFLAMLGLEGTLYGLFIGLGVSQVADLSASALTTDAIHGTLKRLLEGTATAILSSLVGLIGAFVAARPLNWFRHLALLDQTEVVEDGSLIETARRLTGELGTLCEASRTFAAELRPELLRDLFGRMDDTLRALGGTAAVVSSCLERLDQQLELQTRTNEVLINILKQNETGRLWFEAAWNRMADGAVSGRADLARLLALSEQTLEARQSCLAEIQAGRVAALEALSALLLDSRAGRNDMLAALNSLRDAAADAARATGGERDAWRQALIAYLDKAHGSDRVDGGSRL